MPDRRGSARSPAPPLGFGTCLRSLGVNALRPLALILLLIIATLLSSVAGAGGAGTLGDCTKSWNDILVQGLQDQTCYRLLSRRPEGRLNFHSAGLPLSGSYRGGNQVRSLKSNIVEAGFGSYSECVRHLSMVNGSFPDLSSAGDADELNFTTLASTVTAAVSLINNLTTNAQDLVWSVPVLSSLQGQMPGNISRKVAMSAAARAWLSQGSFSLETDTNGQSMDYLTAETRHHLQEVIDIIALAQSSLQFVHCGTGNGRCSSKGSSLLDDLCSSLREENCSTTTLLPVLSRLLKVLSARLVQSKINSLVDVFADFHAIIVSHPAVQGDNQAVHVDQLVLKADTTAALCAVSALSTSTNIGPQHAPPISSGPGAATAKLCGCACHRLCSLVRPLCSVYPNICSNNGSSAQTALIAEIKTVLNETCVQKCFSTPTSERTLPESLEDSTLCLDMNSTDLQRARDSNQTVTSVCLAAANQSMLNVSGCPSPLLPTSVPDYRFKLISDYGVNLSRQVCQMLISHNMTIQCNVFQTPLFSCGKPCRPLYYKQSHSDPVRIAMSLLGTLAFVLSWAAVLVFFTNKKRVKTLARRVIVCLNIGFGVYFFDYVIALSRSAALVVHDPCTADGVLRLKHQGRFDACTFDAYRTVFSLVYIVCLGPPATHAWYRTVNNLTNRNHRSSSRREQKLFAIYHIWVLGVAFISATAGTAAGAIQATPLFGVCRFNSRGWFFAFTVPFVIHTLIALPLLAAGIPKLRALRKTSGGITAIRTMPSRPSTLSVHSVANVNGINRSPPTLARLERTPSTTGSLLATPASPQTPTGAPSKDVPVVKQLRRMSTAVSRRFSRSPSQSSQFRSSTEGLTRLMKLLLVYLVIYCVQSAVVFIVHMEAFFSKESKEDDQSLLRYTLCVMVYGDENASKCPAIPTKNIVYQIMLHLFTVVISIVFTTWAYEWAYWTWIPCFRSKAVTSVDSQGSSHLSSSNSPLNFVKKRFSLFKQTSKTSVQSEQSPSGRPLAAANSRPVPSNGVKRGCNEIQFVSTPV